MLLPRIEQMDGKENFVKAIVAVGLCLSANIAFAQVIIYDNTAAASYQTKFASSGNEFGDELKFDLGTTQRILTQIQIEYFANLTTLGDDFVRFRLYINDGANGSSLSGGATIGTMPGPISGGTRQIPNLATTAQSFSPSVSRLAPGTLIYDSDADAPGGIPIFNGHQTTSISSMQIVLPSDGVTLTAQFSLSGSLSESAGLVVYSPPTTGSSTDDYWQKDIGGWTLYRDPSGSPQYNFGVRVVAVPEPESVATLSAVALLLYIALRRCRLSALNALRHSIS
ncbi:MAG: hypothetical protein HY043_24125 [Verrucomicrobia bacterium]|nr:hypothetical protein [Verrucomicrobiota bacterium]